jgi:flavin-binding protein dodecin
MLGDRRFIHLPIGSPGLFAPAHRRRLVAIAGATHTPPVGAAYALQKATNNRRNAQMTESVYKVIELVGTSTDSWEKAAKAAVERAGKSLRDLRVAEVLEQDLVIEKGKVTAYRTKLKVSFKYEDG